MGLPAFLAGPRSPYLRRAGVPQVRPESAQAGALEGALADFVLAGLSIPDDLIRLVLGAGDRLANEQIRRGPGRGEAGAPRSALAGAYSRATEPALGGLRAARARAHEQAGPLAGTAAEVLAPLPPVGAAARGARALPAIAREYRTGREALGALQTAMAIPTWHGTPHTWRPGTHPEAAELGQPIREARLTGEGAAAYGAGDLYSAEAPGVARSYASSRPGNQLLWRDGSEVPDVAMKGTPIADALEEGRREDALRIARSGARRHGADGQLGGAYDQVARRLEAGENPVRADSAYWLTLDDGQRVLVDPEHPDEAMAEIGRELDAQRRIIGAHLPAAEAGSRLAERLSKTPSIGKNRARAVELLRRARSIEPAAPQPNLYRVALPGEREQYLSWDEEAPAELAKRLGIPRGTGAALYQQIGVRRDAIRRMPEFADLPAGGPSDEFASAVLERAGIPGIRYRDAMSRAPKLSWQRMTPDLWEQLAQRLEQGSPFTVRIRGGTAPRQWDNRGLAALARAGDVRNLQDASEISAPLSEAIDAVVPAERSTENFVSFRGEDVVPLARGSKSEALEAIEQRAHARLEQLIAHHRERGNAARAEELERMRAGMGERRR